MINNSRNQLTLFVAQAAAVTIENIRAAYNPRQNELIKCHVTLCREDEIQDLEKVVNNLLQLPQTALVIRFGKPIRFDDGKGVLLPATHDNQAFQRLRRQVLQGLFEHPRLHEPHITLMHPRNSTCTDEIFAAICNINFPAELVFNQIDLIEQVNGGPWETLQTFPLSAKKM